jgi:hypothetical protein
MNIAVVIVAVALGAVVAGMLDAGRRRQLAREARLLRDGQTVNAVVERIDGVGRYGALQRCEATFADAGGNARVARWVWPTALVHARGVHVGAAVNVIHVPGSDLAAPPPDPADDLATWVAPAVFAFIVALGALLGLVVR